MPAPKDLTNQAFGRLTAICVSRLPKRSWICRCECGATVTVETTKLTTGHTRSCGCLQRDILRKRNTTHNMSDAYEYQLWLGMKSRCYDPQHSAYARYGGKGIKVCDEWRYDFPQFRKDMGPRPLRMTLDRINNDGNYSPENCRWATYKEQSTNSSVPHIVVWNGRRLSITDWARHLGIGRMTLQQRLVHGWSIERALTEPVPAKSGPKRGVKRGPYKTRSRNLVASRDEPS